jgi:sortase (surface protein transpeptidase)
MNMSRRIKIGIGSLLLGVAFAAIAVALYPQSVDGDPESIELSLAPTTNPTPTYATAPTTPVEQPEPDPAWQEFVTSAKPGFSISSAQPVGLRIERIGIEAPIKPYGVDQRTGEMDVPRNVTDVAWYKHGPAPGESGSAVLAAHVDLSDQGKGIFFNLKDLAEGDQIFVTFDNGTEAGFLVVARTMYSKDELPIHSIFSRSGPPTLTLITCGGGFNASVNRYDSNVVVYATSIDQTRPRNPIIN